jgi:UDP-N-acetylglucosamine 2-epimerase (non-hydrolysing)
MKNDSILKNEIEKRFSFLDHRKKLILVTGHRRESFGIGFKNICEALVEIAKINTDVEIIYPVHLNPNVQEPVCDIIGKAKLRNVHLIDPVEYMPFVYLMSRAFIIITDSGGIQEEAPSLGKPVLVMRETTERPEAVESGAVMLVGTQKEMIVSSVNTLLNEDETYLKMSNANNPYGDGCSSKRICNIVKEYLTGSLFS